MPTGTGPGRLGGCEPPRAARRSPGVRSAAGRRRDPDRPDRPPRGGGARATGCRKRRGNLAPARGGRTPVLGWWPPPAATLTRWCRMAAAPGAGSGPRGRDRRCTNAAAARSRARRGPPSRGRWRWPIGRRWPPPPRPPGWARGRRRCAGGCAPADRTGVRALDGRRRPARPPPRLRRLARAPRGRCHADGAGAPAAGAPGRLPGRRRPRPGPGGHDRARWRAGAGAGAGAGPPGPPGCRARTDRPLPGRRPSQRPTPRPPQRLPTPGRSVPPLRFA